MLARKEIWGDKVTALNQLHLTIAELTNRMQERRITTNHADTAVHVSPRFESIAVLFVPGLDIVGWDQRCEASHYLL